MNILIYTALLSAVGAVFLFSRGVSFARALPKEEFERKFNERIIKGLWKGKEIDWRRKKIFAARDKIPTSQGSFYRAVCDSAFAGIIKGKSGLFYEFI